MYRSDSSALYSEKRRRDRFDATFDHFVIYIHDFPVQNGLQDEKYRHKLKEPENGSSIFYNSGKNTVQSDHEDLHHFVVEPEKRGSGKIEDPGMRVQKIPLRDQYLRKLQHQKNGKFKQDEFYEKGDPFLHPFPREDTTEQRMDPEPDQIG